MTNYVAEIEAAAGSREHSRYVDIEFEANDIREAIMIAQAKAEEMDGRLISVAEPFC